MNGMVRQCVIVGVVRRRHEWHGTSVCVTVGVMRRHEWHGTSVCVMCLQAALGLGSTLAPNNANLMFSVNICTSCGKTS